MKKYLILLSIGYFCLQNCASAQQSMQDLLMNNQQALTELSVNLKKNKESELLQKSFLTSTLFGDFSTRLEKTKKISPDYFATLSNYRRLLRKSSETADSATISKTLEFISNDISLKFSKGATLVDELSGAVTVTVKVVDSANHELSGYDVSLRYNLEIDDTFMQQFNPTNNAHKDILPGWYLIRISKNRVPIAERSEYVIVNTDNTFIFNVQP